MALLSIDQFVTKYNGKAVDIDKAYGPQCWDLAEAYCREVLGIPANPWALPTQDGTAYGSYRYKPDPISTYFSRVGRKRTPLGILNSRPKRGDLIFWLPTLPGSGGAGHVDICISDQSQNKRSFLGFDQNWAGKYAHRVTHDYTYVQGYLRPKVTPK